MRAAALYLGFAALGVSGTYWRPLLGHWQLRYGLSDAALGRLFALAGLAGLVGALVMTRVSRFPRAGIGLASFLLLGSTGVLPCDVSLVTFTAAIVALGLALGVLSVGFNHLASAGDRVGQSGRLGRFHALYSAGAGIGGLAAPVLATWSSASFSMVAGGMLCAVAAILSIMVPTEGEAPKASAESISTAEATPGVPARGKHLAFVAIAAGFAASTVDASLASWGPALARRDLLAPPAFAGLPYAAFALGVFLGRMRLDSFAAAREASALMRFATMGALSATALFALFAEADQLSTALVAGLLCALGAILGWLMPLAVRLCGAAVVPGRAIAWVVVGCYAGAFAGPWCVGVLVDAASGNTAVVTMFGATVVASRVARALSATLLLSLVPLGIAFASLAASRRLRAPGYRPRGVQP